MAGREGAPSGRGPPGRRPPPVLVIPGADHHRVSAFRVPDNRRRRVQQGRSGRRIDPGQRAYRAERGLSRHRRHP
jgi:hypothetical protein